MTNLETEPAPLPPPATGPLPHERRWARSDDDRVVFGVAGGLGRALAIEPLFLRIAFVVLALFSGVGILLYIAGLAMLADSPTSPPTNALRRIGGAVAVLLSARLLFSGDAQLPDAGWVVAIALFGGAVALWRGRTTVDIAAVPPPTTMPTSTDGGSTSDRWESWSKHRRDRPRPPRSALGLLTIGAATVVGALVWLLAGTGNRGTLAFGWATVVLGAGLVVGAFAGRARWLVVPALATAVAAVGAAALSFAGVGLSDRSGDRTIYVGEGTAIADRYETGMGDFDLVLADYPGDLTTTVEVGVGDLTVVVPDNAQVQINARVGLGSIDALGSSRNGYRRSLILDDQPDATHLIKLVLRVGVGTIDVRRASFANVPFITVPTFLPLPDGPFPEVPVADVPVRQLFGDGTVLYQDGSIGFANGERIEANGSYTIAIVEQRADGSVQLENGAVIDADGSVVTPGGFVIPREILTAPLSTTTSSLAPMSTTTAPTEVPQP